MVKQTEQKEADTEAVRQTGHEKCDYVGEGKYNLDDHVFWEEEHLPVIIVEEISKADLMIQRKIEHTEKVKPCRNCPGGGCDLKDEDC